MKDKEKQIFKFSVIDNKTGEYPDLYNIALKEDWAKGLMYSDMEGFSINEDGQLILSDECGKFVYCPSDRFTVVFEDSVVLTNDNAEELANLIVTSPQMQSVMSDLIKAWQKETAEKIYRELCEHGTTYVKKWIKEQFGVEITTDDNCKYYDKVRMRCNGAKCTPECYCNGHKSECTEYPETRKQFGVEIKE